MSKYLVLIGLSISIANYAFAETTSSKTQKQNRAENDQNDNSKTVTKGHNCGITDLGYVGETTINRVYLYNRSEKKSGKMVGIIRTNQKGGASLDLIDSKTSLNLLTIEDLEKSWGQGDDIQPEGQRFKLWGVHASDRRKMEPYQIVVRIKNNKVSAYKIEGSRILEPDWKTIN